MVDGASGGGDGSTIDVEGDDGWLARVGSMNLAERKRLEEEGNAVFLAGRLDEAAEASYRAKLLKACAGIDCKAEQSMMKITSPTGRYQDNPKVLSGEFD